MQLVVVMAVRKAVAAATITFTAISIKRFFIIVNVQCSTFNVQCSTFNSGPCRHRGYRHRQCCHLRFLRVPNREQIDFVDRYYRAKRDETENARK